MENFEMVATTVMGLEKILAAEIEVLGGQEIEIAKRAVKFLGNEELLYKANLSLHTALRVLVPIDSFTAYDDTDLYEETKKVAWEKIMTLEHTFLINASVAGTIFNHSQYAALKVKDGIVDRFREKKGRRPNVEKQDPDMVINVHITEDQVVLSLDSSGTSLNKRGYRPQANEAPISEVLAAGIIKMSGWHNQLPFYDPMSGSGTFSIEAALLGTNTPPGLHRKFAFENWVDFDRTLYKKVKADLTDKIISPNIEIYARDILTSNIETIAANVGHACMEDHVNLKKEDFFCSKAKNPLGIVFLNPPYGERMKVEEIEAFYSQIGDTLKQNYVGCQAWIISSDKAAMKRIGLKADQKTDLMNGGLEARLQKYTLFSGKKNTTDAF
jgi:putative N6-adenine-specific DNA methylase